MKVFFDYQIFSLQKYGGISRYFYELMNNFSKMDGIEFELPIHFSNNQYLISADFINVKTVFPNVVLGIKNYYTRYLNSKNLLKSKSFILNNQFDLMHPTYYNPYFLDLIKNKPFVITIHDLTFEKYRHLIKYNDYSKDIRKKIFNSASKIIAVSENTKKDIIEYYNIDPQKIKVVYHGNSLKINQKTKVSQLKLKIPKEYLLFVGNRKGYKNFNNFIRAAALLIRTNKNLNVLCAGGGKFKESEMKLFNNLRISKNIKYIKVNDLILSQIYNNAAAFVFPSFYEGFGLPILEAFACECPVILSNSSCFPEIAGEAAVYFNPSEVDDIKNKIELVLTDNNLRKKLIEKGTERINDFSWKKTAVETKMVYESII